jgi:hypothetical protein
MGPAKSGNKNLSVYSNQKREFLHLTDPLIFFFFFQGDDDDWIGNEAKEEDDDSPSNLSNAFDP